MPVGDQDHGAVAMTMAVVLGRLDQLGDLGLGQVLTGPIGIVGTSGFVACLNCYVFDSWGNDFQVRFCHCFQFLDGIKCNDNASFYNSFRENVTLKPIGAAPPPGTPRRSRTTMASNSVSPDPT